MERAESSKLPPMENTSEECSEPLQPVTPLDSLKRITTVARQDDEILETMTVPERSNTQRLSPLGPRPHTDYAKRPETNILIIEPRESDNSIPSGWNI